MTSPDPATTRSSPKPTIAPVPGRESVRGSSSGGVVVLVEVDGCGEVDGVPGAELLDDADGLVDGLGEALADGLFDGLGEGLVDGLLLGQGWP